MLTLEVPVWTRRTPHEREPPTHSFAAVRKRRDGTLPWTLLLDQGAIESGWITYTTYGPPLGDRAFARDRETNWEQQGNEASF